MLNNKLCLTSVVEFLRRGRVDRGTGGGKVVVVVDSSKRKVASSAHSNATANEGHVNYDVSDVSVKAIGSRTTGSGCATVGY